MPARGSESQRARASQFKSEGETLEGLGETLERPGENLEGPGETLEGCEVCSFWGHTPGGEDGPQAW